MVTILHIELENDAMIFGRDENHPEARRISVTGEKVCNGHRLDCARSGFPKGHAGAKGSCRALRTTVQLTAVAAAKQPATTIHMAS